MPSENISNADLSRDVVVFLIEVPYYLYTWILIRFFFMLFLILCGLLKIKTFEKTPHNFTALNCCTC